MDLPASVVSPGRDAPDRRRHGPSFRFLPDDRANCVGANHRITRFTAKRGGKLGHVGHRTIHAPSARCVRIRKNTLLLVLRRDVLSPDLGPGEEETVFGRESVDQSGTGLSGQSFLERSVGNVQSAEVANVFAKRELALDVNGIEYEVVVELS